MAREGALIGAIDQGTSSSRFLVRLSTRTHTCTRIPHTHIHAQGLGVVTPIYAVVTALAVGELFDRHFCC